MRRHLIVIALIVVAPFWVVNACGQNNPNLQRFEFSEPHMGTMFRIVFYAPDEAAAKKAAKAAFARIAELNRIMSDYLPDSELMRLCKQSEGKPVEVSIDLFHVLQQADRFSRLSEGAFDVSISPVVRLWRKARRTRELPSEAELRKALDLVDYRKIRLSETGRTVQLLLAGMLLDLGGIAKGYAADAVLAVLREHGITRALVAAGGDVAVSDAPPDKAAWRIGIAPLKNPDAPPTHYLALVNAAVSTSGDSEQYVEIQGLRYSHIADPKSGLGLIGRRSVSVIAKNATTTDALATACCVLGADRGLKLVEGQSDVAALFVFEGVNGVETIPSKRFAQFGVK